MRPRRPLRFRDSDTYLEDHPVTKRKWLITRVIISPQDLWLWDLFVNGRTPWLFQWGLHPNYLRVMGSHPPSIAKQRFLGLNESDFVDFFKTKSGWFFGKKHMCLLWSHQSWNGIPKNDGHIGIGDPQVAILNLALPFLKLT